MSVHFDYTGQVALITGASSGMGLATARAFAEAGASTVLVDVNEATVNAAADTLAREGHTVLALTVDVSQEDQVADMIRRTVEAFGRVDVAFNNAGIMIPAAGITDTGNDVFDRVTAVNFRGVWNCLKHELIHMQTQGAGAVVNCSSIAGLVGDGTRAAYSASKHAIVGLTKSAALEVGKDGIRVNAVNPGTIDTPMVDRMVAIGDLNRDAAIGASAIPRLGRPEEIAAAVLWLSSPAASYITGIALPVDGGYTAH